MSTLNKLPTQIEHFLQDKGFILSGTIENGRHIILKGTMPAYADPVIIKIKSEAAIMQRNHVLWTKYMQDTIREDAPFHIAPVLASGTIEQRWHWFIMPFIEGAPFATENPRYLTTTTFGNDKELLSRIVSLMHHIERTDALSVTGIDARVSGASRRDKLKLLEHAIGWARSDTPYLAQLLQLINKNYASLGTANSHGDFTETNLIINAKNEPILIDAEISDAFNYRSYDAVEFYNRLYTRLCSPELAKAFLKLYVGSLPSQSHRKFFSNFLCLSALRCLGNMTEIATFHEGAAKDHRMAFEQRYAEAIVNYDIITLID